MAGFAEGGDTPQPIRRPEAEIELWIVAMIVSRSLLLNRERHSAARRRRAPGSAAAAPRRRIPPVVRSSMPTVSSATM
jgi:hypothetical protein